MGDAVVSEAQDVILAEARALRMLADSLDEDESFSGFVASLVDFADVGRLVITGVGKSAIVGQKIAATFRSLGYPAHFIHAFDALHGDLGGIVDGDTLLALSASGKTPEVLDVLRYADRMGLTTALMTRSNPDIAFDAANPDIAFDAGVDFLLFIPDLPEADETGLVPTTSTTCMLALGDALALTVAARIGSTKNTLRRLHPGGSIGEKLREEGAG